MPNVLVTVFSFVYNKWYDTKVKKSCVTCTNLPMIQYTKYWITHKRD